MHNVDKGLTMMRLQQGFATSEMGVGPQFAQQQTEPVHVSYGSRTDIVVSDVRFVPKADISSVWKLREPAHCTPPSDGGCP